MIYFHYLTRLSFVTFMILKTPQHGKIGVPKYVLNTHRDDQPLIIAKTFYTSQLRCVPYPLTLFIGCLIVNMFICLEQSSPGHLEHIQNVTSVIKSGWIWSFI